MSKKILNKNLKSRKTPVTGSLLYSANSAEVFDIKKTLWLYRFVYGSRLSLSVVLLLLISFSTQSIERVYASEEVAVDSVVEVESAPPDIQEPELIENVPTEATENPVAETVEGEMIQEDVSTEAIIDNTNTEDTVEVIPEEETVLEVPTEEEIVVSDSTSTEEVLIDEEEVEEADVSDSVDSNDLDADGADEEEQEVLPEEDTTATTSEEVPEEGLPITHEAVSVTQSDSEFSFKKYECTQLATGSFYCLQPQENEL